MSRSDATALRAALRPHRDTLGHNGSLDPERGWIHLWWSETGQTMEVRLRLPQNPERRPDFGAPAHDILTAAGWVPADTVSRRYGCATSYRRTP